MLVDTQARRTLLHGIVHRRRRSGIDGGLALLATLFGLFPFLGKLFADRLSRAAFTAPWPASCPISRPRSSSDPIGCFVVQPRRWVVERTIAWLNRCRRLAKDWENLNRNALAFIKLASMSTHGKLCIKSPDGLLVSVPLCSG